MAPATVHWIVETDIDERWLAPLEAACSAVLALDGTRQTPSLSVLLTDDASLQRLNADFLGENRPTDVLSFASDDARGQKEAYLGDIAISVMRAVAQAAVAGHTTLAELQLLLVHGVLHLLGYDHALPAEKAAMWRAQSEVLATLGVSVRLPA